jgi:hypothetical protein
MTNTVRRNVLPCLVITVGLGLSQAAQAALSHPLISKVSMPKEFGRVLGLSEK